MFFGEESHLRDKIILQHQSAGKISELYPNVNLRKRAGRLQHHLSLINECLELSNLVENHHEEVANSHYVSNLIAILTPSDRKDLRENNPTLQDMSPLEQVLAIQKEMKTMLEHTLEEQKILCSTDEDTSDSVSVSDDSDKNPLFLNS